MIFHTLLLTIGSQNLILLDPYIQVQGQYSVLISILYDKVDWIPVEETGWFWGGVGGFSLIKFTYLFFVFGQTASADNVDPDQTQNVVSD